MAKKPIQALCQHLQGIDAIHSGHLCKLFFDEDSLKISAAAGGIFKQKYGDTYTIPIARIISVDLVTEKDIQEKSKSVVGRGIAGGIIFGPIGAIIGGMSGTGSKKQQILDRFINIAYENNGDIKILIFKAMPDVGKEYDLVKYYKNTYVLPTMERNDSGEIML